MDRLARSTISVPGEYIFVTELGDTVVKTVPSFTSDGEYEVTEERLLFDGATFERQVQRGGVRCKIDLWSSPKEIDLTAEYVGPLPSDDSDTIVILVKLQPGNVYPRESTDGIYYESDKDLLWRNELKMAILTQIPGAEPGLKRWFAVKKRLSSSEPMLILDVDFTP